MRTHCLQPYREVGQMDKEKRPHKIKDFLNRVRNQVIYCKTLDTELQQVRADSYSLQSSLGGSGGGSSGNTADLANRTVRTGIYEERLKKALEKRNELKNKAFDMIEALGNDDEKAVLVSRYLTGLKWEEVCVEVHKAWMTTHRCHAHALRELEEKYGSKK